jgi:hypothetical protein
MIRWDGSKVQGDALTRLSEASQTLHAALQNVAALGVQHEPLRRYLEEAHWRILRAECSSHFFGDDTAVIRCHQDLNEASAQLDRAWACLR